MKKYKNWFFFGLLFILFLFWNLFITELYADEVWNYGFSYSIYRGLLPYKDFNMVITPFYPFLMAFSFYVLGFNMIVFHIVNALILTGLSYLLYKLIGEKFLIALIFLILPTPNTFPSYNLLIMAFFVLLLYLEKNQKNDYLVGVVLGLSILTKQSVGVCMALPSLFYFKDKKKLLKRLIGMMIPIFVFVVYLLISHTMMEFLDLCLFGLFDFTKNQSSFSFIYILVILYFVVCIYWIKKDSKNIFYYYALAMIGMTIPLFDLYHFQISVFCLFSVFCLTHEKIKIPLNPQLLFCGILLGVGVYHWIYLFHDGLTYPNKIHNFEYRALSKSMIDYTNIMNQFIEDHSGREVVFLTNNAYYFRIVRDEKISMVDLINYGNHGYGGNAKLMKLIKSKKDAIFIVDLNELAPRKQTNKNVIKYVVEKGEKVDQIGEVYDIYVFNHEYE